MKIFLLLLILFCDVSSYELVTRVNISKTTQSISKDFNVMRVSDIDADGDEDLICGSTISNTLLWLDNVSGKFIEYVIDDSCYTPTSIIVEDYDGDGDADIIYYSSYSGDVCLYRNDHLMFTKIKLLSSLSASSVVAIKDFDNDGDMDLLTSTIQGGKLTLFEKSNGSYREHLIDSNVYVDDQIEVLDYNKNGLYDIVAVKDTRYNGEGVDVLIYQNGGSNQFISKPVRIDIGHFTGFHCFDFNQDGVMDLFLEYYIYSKLIEFRTLDVRVGDIYNYIQRSFVKGDQFSHSYGLDADVNGDGLLDIVVKKRNSGGVGENRLYINEKDYFSEFFISNSGDALSDVVKSYNGAYSYITKRDSSNVLDINHFSTYKYPILLFVPDKKIVMNSSMAIELDTLSIVDSNVTFYVAATPEHGSITRDNFTIIYTPKEGFVGKDSIAYYAVAYDSVYSDTAIVTIEVIDTINIRYNCDYLIVCADMYREEAQRLADFRAGYQYDLIETSYVVSAEMIYATYIKEDVNDSSMREALYHYIEDFKVCSPGLQYIFFVADASDPDEKNGEVIIPSGPTHRYGPIDDSWYVSGDEHISPYTFNQVYAHIAFGRITPDSVVEMKNYVDKVIAYENMVHEGFDWKNSILISLDDDTNDALKGLDPVLHAFDFKNLVLPSIPQYAEKKYVCMDEYEKVIHHAGEPNIFVDIIGDEIDFISQLNSGAFMTMNLSHGFVSGIAMERIFNAPSYSDPRNDIPKLENNGKPSFMLLGGCDLGNFRGEENGKELRSVAEELTLVKNGGAIAATGAITLSYSGLACDFMTQVCNQMYNGSGRVALGDMVRIAKNHYYRGYAKQLNFYGDPAITYKRNQVIGSPILGNENLLVGYDVVDIATANFSYETIGYSTMSIHNQPYNRSFVTYNKTYTYQKEGDLLYFDHSKTASFQLNDLKDTKGVVRALFFADNRDYIYYKGDVALLLQTTAIDEEDLYNDCDFSFGANPIPSGENLTVTYTLPEKYRDNNVQLLLYSRLGIKEIKLQSGSEKNRVLVIEKNPDFVAGSVGRVEVVIDGEVYKRQDIYCER